MGVYKNNNNKWYCRGQINGERYHLPCAGAKDKSEAKAIEDGIRFKIRQQQSGLIKSNKIYTLKFMMNKYIESCELNNKSARTAIIFTKYILLFFGEKTNVTEIKPYEIDNFKRSLLNKGRTKATVNRYISALKRAYNIMIEEDLIETNPTNKTKKLIEDNRRHRYLSHDEWNKLIIVLPPEIKSIVIVALLSGLRKNNVLQLKWEQIDMNLRTIELLKQENKGKKVIKHPISNALYKVLMALEPKEKGYVFVNPKTGLPYTSIRKSFDTALKNAGIEDAYFHDLRRTFGTWLHEEGVSIRTIQELLGHSDVSTTERYLCLTSEQNRKAMEVLDAYIDI